MQIHILILEAKQCKLFKSRIEENIRNYDWKIMKIKEKYSQHVTLQNIKQKKKID